MKLTVGELAILLMKYPRDLRVVVDAYEGGLDDPSLNLEPVVFFDDRPDVARDYWGAHDVGSPTDAAHQTLQGPALVISRHMPEGE